MLHHVPMAALLAPQPKVRGNTLGRRRAASQKRNEDNILDVHAPGIYTLKHINYEKDGAPVARATVQRRGVTAPPLLGVSMANKRVSI